MNRRTSPSKCTPTWHPPLRSPTVPSELYNSFFSGYPSEAYCRFVEGLSHIEGYLHKQAIKDLEDLGFLYRVRKKVFSLSPVKNYSTYLLNSRHLVATQRYSIPGLPCLYLRGSLHMLGRDGKAAIPRIANSSVLAHSQSEDPDSESLEFGRRDYSITTLPPMDFHQNPRMLNRS